MPFEQIFRICAGIIGALLLGSAAFIARKKRLSASFLSVGVLIALGVVALLCAASETCVRAILHPSQMTRIRHAVGAVTLVALLATIDAIRRAKLKEKYALLWIFPCLAVIALTVSTRFLEFLRGEFGMEYSSTMAAVVFLSLLFAVFVLSKNISKMERDIAVLVQKCALLEARLNELAAGAGATRKTAEAGKSGACDCGGGDCGNDGANEFGGKDAR